MTLADKDGDPTTAAGPAPMAFAMLAPGLLSHCDKGSRKPAG
jgi:hypothetical protein